MTFPGGGGRRESKLPQIPFLSRRPIQADLILLPLHFIPFSVGNSNDPAKLPLVIFPSTPSTCHVLKDNFL